LYKVQQLGSTFLLFPEKDFHYLITDLSAFKTAVFHSKKIIFGNAAYQIG